MIFYAKDFGILPDSETAKKHDTVFSEKEAKKKALEAKRNAENIK